MRPFPCRFTVSLFPWLPLDRQGPLPFLRHFSCKEIKRATDGFSTIIGSGSQGAIYYKAQFSDGLVAAVKEVRTFQHGKDEFYGEVQLLGCLHHRHLVRLQGFSIGQDRFLVFEYIENGSLKEHLRDPLKTPLSWRSRLQIAVDVAAALEYLLYFCDPPVYHVSISSSNVLLDENFVAKLSGIGFLDSTGKCMPKPDTTSRGRTDQKCRHVIFQFGVLILELVTGQSLGNEGADLVEWVEEFGFPGSMHKMVDTDLGNSYNSRELKSLLLIARLCTRAPDKPTVTIPQILRYLQRKVEPSILCF